MVNQSRDRAGYGRDSLARAGADGEPGHDRRRRQDRQGKICCFETAKRCSGGSILSCQRGVQFPGPIHVDTELTDRSAD